MKTAKSGMPAGAVSDIPAYQRIKNYVIDNIRSGVWKAGDPIPKIGRAHV